MLKRDIYLFLGTNRQWHIRKSPNPFMIIGVFYPPKIEEKIEIKEDKILQLETDLFYKKVENSLNINYHAQ